MTVATPLSLALTGDSVTGAENKVRLTCSPARNPLKITSWVPPATIVGDAICSGTAVGGAVGGAELDDEEEDEDDGAVKLRTPSSWAIGALVGLAAANTEQGPVTQFGAPVTDGRVRVALNEPLPTSAALMCAHAALLPLSVTGAPRHLLRSVGPRVLPQTAT